MRAFVVVLLLVGGLALAGCSSSPEKPDTAVDPEKAEPSDYLRGAIVVAVLIVVVAVLIGAVVLARRRRRDDAGPRDGKPKGP